MLMKFAALLDLEYRWSFFVQICVELLYFSITLLSIKVVYSNIASVAGWNYNSMLILMGVNMIFSEILLGIAFIYNFRRLPAKILSGEVDLVLIKPLNSQFTLSLAKPYFALFPGVLAGIIIVLVGVRNEHIIIHILPLIFSLILLTCGLIIGYGISSIICTLSFWLVNTQPLPYLAEQVSYMARNPHSVYTGGWKILFAFFIPVSFMVSIPTRALMGYIEWWWIPAAILLASIFLTASAKFWNFALKNYTSASS